MDTREKYIGEAPIGSSPRKKIALKLGKGVVRPEHLSKEIVNEFIKPEVSKAVEEATGQIHTVPDAGGSTPIVEQHNILSDNVTAFLKNTHYKNYSLEDSEIAWYATGPAIEDKYIEETVTFEEPRTGFLIIGMSPMLLEPSYEGFNDGVGNSLVFGTPLENSASYAFKNLVPNTTYYWIIMDEKQSSILEKGTVRHVGLRRFLDVTGAYNVRDLGGIPTSDGRNVRYGKLIRGSEPTATFEDVLNIAPNNSTYILDLRSPVERDHVPNPYRMEWYKYKPILNMPNYLNVPNMGSSYKEGLRDAVNYVLDRVNEGNSVYFHCVWGAHRTGLLASILLSFLGVPQSEIDKDYELTSFSKNYREDTASENLRRNSNAIGYKQGVEYIRDNYGSSWTRFAIEELGISEDKILKFKDAMIVNYVKDDDAVPVYYEVTYAKLKDLVDRKLLVPGAKYRIIDYETIIGRVDEANYSGGSRALVDAESAGHKFDLLVTALDNVHLDCKAKALHSTRDTEGYFTNTDLSKWEVWYDINNDSSKYNWASDNCKGIIYRMIDERSNDVPYDFKNMTFNGLHTFGTYGLSEGMTLSHTKDTEFSMTLAPYTIISEERTWSYAQYIYTFSNIRGVYVLLRPGGNTEASVYVRAQTPTNRTISRTLTFNHGIRRNDGMMHYGDVTYFDDIELDSLVVYSAHADFTIGILVDGNSPHVTASNNTIRPWIVDGRQCLNENVFITERSSDAISHNYIDYHCTDNKITGIATNNMLKPYCSNNSIESSDLVKLQESCVFNTIKNSVNVSLGVENTYNTIDDCVNVVTEPNVSQCDIAGYGKVDKESTLVKHKNDNIVEV